MSDPPRARGYRTRAAGWSLIVALVAPADAMDVSGYVSLGTIYTDNVTLAPKGFEQGDFVVRADPTIVLASIGRRYDFQLEYTLEALWYQDQPDSTEVYNQGSTNLDIEILEEHLFLNSLASISQAVIDPEQPFSSTNVPQIGNRTDAIRYQTGPEWRQDILGSNLDIRYDIGRVDYSDEALQDGDYQNLNTDWTGPDKDRGLTWEFRHEYRNYDYEISDNATRQLAEVSLIYKLSGGWAPFVSAGMESDVTDRTDASLQDGIWRAGLRRETARNFFEAYAGERSFGSAWGASFEHQYGAESGDILRMAYHETPRTSEGLDSTLSKPSDPPGDTTPPGPVTPPPVTPPGATAPGTGRFYLSKRGDILLVKSFNRNAVSLNAFYEDDETLEEATPADSDNTREVGVSLAWLYDFGARTQGLVDGYYVNREFSRVSAADDSDNLFRLRVGLNYMV
ncbi:MAG: TIGR03016 family PEP-CTERM system-associated outer membrane protein, partial [Gammaproteobacteria bacterium]